ncbi:phenoloxidase-activating factor 1-like [Oratosquilla oratoria]|uniref:phenoloxidase-activating factor 1-like n=1 Tax=Oratosquilla oratoria TaxID=337810 RepID=UPI003F768950
MTSHLLVSLWALMALTSVAPVSGALRAPRQASPRPGCNCIPIQSCTLLLNLLKSKHPQAAPILRSALCGLQNNRVQVCCPTRSTGTTQVTPPVTSVEPPVQLPEECGKSSTDGRIHGGDEAAPGQFPWMALLGSAGSGSNNPSFFCGGSIITDRYILTASHCNDHGLLRGRVLNLVRLGEYKISTDPDCVTLNNSRVRCIPPFEDFGIERFISHPDFGKPLAISNDVGLIRVDRKIDFGSYIRPVCLPPPDLTTEDLDTTPLTVSGWGSTETSVRSDTLLFVRVPYVDLKTCNDDYLGILRDSQLCAGGEPGRDSCKGDSGGPLVRLKEKQKPPYQQVGIVSFGSKTGCATPGVPAVYTSVLAYRSWIIRNLRP